MRPSSGDLGGELIDAGGDGAAQGKHDGDNGDGADRENRAENDDKTGFGCGHGWEREG